MAPQTLPSASPAATIHRAMAASPARSASITTTTGINVNTAGLEDLQRVKGIGPVLALYPDGFDQVPAHLRVPVHGADPHHARIVVFGGIVLGLKLQVPARFVIMSDDDLVAFLDDVQVPVFAQADPRLVFSSHVAIFLTDGL
jgi:hypothetical protein